jgi:hypothetical protein
VRATNMPDRIYKNLQTDQTGVKCLGPEQLAPKRAFQSGPDAENFHDRRMVIRPTERYPELQ